MKCHLLSRLRKEQLDEDFPQFSLEEQRNIDWERDRIYSHATLRLNYTTYDVQRAQDNIHMNTKRCDVVVPSLDSSAHPFWYARVLRIFHANVIYKQKTERMEFLFVRWFGLEVDSSSGWDAKRLDRVGFVDTAEDSAEDFQFGFLDPQSIIRACHLIPVWCEGLLDGEWKLHYVNRYASSSILVLLLLTRGSHRFVDRDMLMRYIGGGIGHVNRPYTPTNPPLQASEPPSSVPADDAPSHDSPQPVAVQECCSEPEDVAVEEIEALLEDEDVEPLSVRLADATVVAEEPEDEGSEDGTGWDDDDEDDEEDGYEEEGDHGGDIYYDVE